jgi:hypothetical protein
LHISYRKPKSKKKDRIMKPWIVWMCFGLLYLGVQEAEARRITGGKPMAPRSPSINYEQLQQHRTKSRAGYQSGYYDQAYQAEVRRGRSVNSMVESNTGNPPIYPLNYGSLRRSVLEDDDTQRRNFNPFRVKPEYGTRPSSRPRPRYPTEGVKSPIKLF